ncbi:hypothetical protein EV687_0921 [Corticibacter populi]|nr:hypothetical protein EV687_0921 [Corticibacter populi]
MLDNELLFELRSQSGEVWKLYLNGVVEGFPLGTVVENRAFPLWCALAGEIRKQAAITIGAQ